MTALFCPILGGAVIVSSAVWDVQKILDTVTTIKESIERLEESDYKSAMQLFKEKVLIKLKNDVNPTQLEIQTLEVKSKDAFNKLADTKIEEKLELIKIQIFCAFYSNCYDEKQDKVLQFDKTSSNKQGVIRDLLNERLLDIQHIAMKNYLDYYSENSYTEKEKLKARKMVNAMDYIKRVSFNLVAEEDGIHQAGDFIVKTLSLKSYMIPEGKEDATMTSMHTFKSSHGPEVTIGALFYRDFNHTIYLDVTLSLPDTRNYKKMVEKLYESLFVGCLYEEDHDEKEAAFFIPQLKVKERDGDTTKCFQVDTSFMSKQKGTMSFLLYMEGTIGQGIQQLGTTREFPSPILPFPRRLTHDKMKLLIEGFTKPNKKLKSTAYSVATVIGFMNLTDKLLKVQSSAISSGKVEKKDPWPSEIQPHSTETIFTRKMSYSLAGCVGTSTVVLPHPKNGESIKIFFIHQF